MINGGEDGATQDRDTETSFSQAALMLSQTSWAGGDTEDPENLGRDLPETAASPGDEAARNAGVNRFWF